MLVPGNEIKSPSGCGRSRGNKDDDKRSEYLRNLTNPAAILSWKVLASRNVTYQIPGKRYPSAISGGGDGDGGHVTHLDRLEFFRRVDRVKQYPISPEN